MDNVERQARVSTRRAGSHAEGEDAERAHRIAEAAYFLARQRGFDGGDPVQDWLEAERMIDSLPVGTRKRKKSA